MTKKKGWNETEWNFVDVVVDRSARFTFCMSVCLHAHECEYKWHHFYRISFVTDCSNCTHKHTNTRVQFVQFCWWSKVHIVRKQWKPNPKLTIWPTCKERDTPAWTHPPPEWPHKIHVCFWFIHAIVYWIAERTHCRVDEMDADWAHTHTLLWLTATNTIYNDMKWAARVS